MVAGSRPLAAPDNLMDGAPEEKNSSKRRWGRRRNKRRGQSKRGRKTTEKNITGKNRKLNATK